MSGPALEAGIVGGNMYLCAHGLGLGATGMTFYDDEVTEFFSPHAAGKSLMFLTALGVKDRRNRVRPFRSRVGVLLDSLARGAGCCPGLVEKAPRVGSCMRVKKRMKNSLF